MEDYERMTRRQFMKLPLANWDEEVECFSLVVIPGSGRKRDLHDSGYRTMTFIAMDKKGVAFKRISGHSDIIHFDGIGGHGYRWASTGDGGIPKSVPPRSWSIDCLPKSGFLRIICGDHGMKCGPSLSSFSIYAKEK